MTYLIKTTEQYRCASEDEAKKIINEAKASNKYTVLKYSSELKVKKAKGEIEDEWYRVTITKEFTDEKEPFGSLMPNYTDEKEDTIDED